MVIRNVSLIFCITNADECYEAQENRMTNIDVRLQNVTINWLMNLEKLLNLIRHISAVSIMFYAIKLFAKVFSIICKWLYHIQNDVSKKYDMVEWSNLLCSIKESNQDEI